MRASVQTNNLQEVYTLLLFRYIDHVEKFKKYLHIQHANIKFTSEMKSIICYRFLDIKIVQKTNKFTTLVYRKPTFSGVFTNFESFKCNSCKDPLNFTLYTDLSRFELLSQKLKI